MSKSIVGQMKYGNARATKLVAPSGAVYYFMDGIIYDERGDKVGKAPDVEWAKKLVKAF